MLENKYKIGTFRGWKPSNKTKSSLTENLLVLIKKSLLNLNFEKSKVIGGKNLFFVIGPICNSHSVFLNIGF